MNRKILGASALILALMALMAIRTGPTARDPSQMVPIPTAPPGISAPAEDISFRTSATGAAREIPRAWTPSEASGAVQAGESPAGFGRLDIAARRDGLEVMDFSVRVRGTADAVHDPRSTSHWSYLVPSGCPVLIDVTDGASGWVQTERTVAPPPGESRRFTVDLNPPQIDGEVLLRLVSSADHSPVTKARVISMSDAPPDFQEGSTDALGRVRVPSGPSFRYVITAPGFAALELPAFEAAAQAYQTHKLIPLAVIFGSVDPTLFGHALIEVLYTVADADGADHRRPRAIASADVHADGTWAMPGITVPAEKKALTGIEVGLVADGIRRTLAEGLSIRPGERMEVLDRSVRAGAVILEFTYPSGHPLGEGVRIVLRRTYTYLDPKDPVTESLEGTLDQKGRIRFASLPPGHWSCRVGVEDTMDLEIAGDPIQTVVVPNRAMLAGRILRRGEQPGRAYPTLARHTVVFHLSVESGDAPRLARCDSEGRFRFDFLPAHAHGKITIMCAGDEIEFAEVQGEASRTDLVLKFTSAGKAPTGFFF